jgi:hypothetical protein
MANRTRRPEESAGQSSVTRMTLKVLGSDALVTGAGAGVAMALIGARWG